MLIQLLGHDLGYVSVGHALAEVDSDAVALLF